MEPVFRFVLTRPVTLADRTWSELGFREPSARDIRELGFPFRIATDGSTMEPKADVLAAHMARLADVSPAVIDRMAPGDFTACMFGLLPFFTPSPTRPATAPTA